MESQLRIKIALGVPLHERFSNAFKIALGVPLNERFCDAFFPQKPIFALVKKQVSWSQSHFYTISGRFVEQKLMLSSSFMCNQIFKCQRYNFGHTYVGLKCLTNPPQSHHGINKRLKAQTGLLNKSSCLAPALSVTKFTNAWDMIWSHIVVILKLDLDVQQTHLSLIME